MTKERLTQQDIQNIQKEIFNLNRYKPQWRAYIPVKHPSKKAHYETYRTMKDVPDGIFTFVKQNATYNENPLTAYESSDVYYVDLTRVWSVHQNDLEISENGRIKTDSILKIKENMEDQIEGLILNGATIGGLTQYGLTNWSGVNAGTDGNGNGMDEIYTKFKELKNKLTEDSFKNKASWWAIYDATVDGYLDLLNSTHGHSAREKLISNGIINEGKQHLSKNLTADSGDAAAILLEPDLKNFYVSELTNGIEVKPLLGGFLDTDFCFKGYLKWQGCLIVVNPNSIAKNTGIASS